MKKTMTLVLAILLLSGILPPALGEASPPISSGTVNKTTNIYWGKGEHFPLLATVFAGAKLDVYEYDANWVLVLYKTYVTYMGKYTEQSFYGYIRRSDIDCEPPLEGEAFPKADTGPGKKKGKRPKPNATPQPAEPTPETTKTPAETERPDVTVEPMEEFDWIIRTDGLQTETVEVQGLTVACSFSLMAQKTGGTAASSDPTYNHGMHTPYAATAYYSMKKTMASALEELGMSSFASGEGGIDVSLQTSGASFYIDTGAQNFALVNFTLPMQSDISAAVSVEGNSGGANISAAANIASASGSMSLNIQLKKSGGGYKFVLVGLKPGGGNLEFPAVLEKTFTDPDRFDKEARDADARRKKAEAERDKWLEDMKKWADDAAKATEATPDPLEGVNLTGTEDPLQDVSLSPTENPLDNVTLVPPSPDEEAPPFPAPLGRLERREIKCV